MIRLLLLSLIFMPAATLPSISTYAEQTQIEASAETSPEAEESSASSFSPMQEEIIHEHSTFGPLVSPLCEKHVAAPDAPLFPIKLVDLFRPPKHA